jgi:hypothetical protein
MIVCPTKQATKRREEIQCADPACQYMTLGVGSSATVRHNFALRRVAVHATCNIKHLNKNMSGHSSRCSWRRRLACSKNVRKTATTPVLMPCAWVRAPSIERLASSRAVCAATTAPKHCAASLSAGTVLKKSVRAPSGRLSGAAGAGFTRWRQQLGAHGWFGQRRTVVVDPGRALGPMPTVSARERWCFFRVL